MGNTRRSESACSLSAAAESLRAALKTRVDMHHPQRFCHGHAREQGNVRLQRLERALTHRTSFAEGGGDCVLSAERENQVLS